MLTVPSEGSGYLPVPFQTTPHTQRAQMCFLQLKLDTRLTSGQLNQGIRSALCQFLCVNELGDRAGIMA